MWLRCVYNIIEYFSKYCIIRVCRHVFPCLNERQKTGVKRQGPNSDRPEGREARDGAQWTGTSGPAASSRERGPSEAVTGAEFAAAFALGAGALAAESGAAQAAAAGLKAARDLEPDGAAPAADGQPDPTGLDLWDLSGIDIDDLADLPLLDLDLDQLMSLEVGTDGRDVELPDVDVQAFELAQLLVADVADRVEDYAEFDEQLAEVDVAAMDIEELLTLEVAPTEADAEEESEGEAVDGAETTVAGTTGGVFVTDGTSDGEVLAEASSGSETSSTDSTLVGDTVTLASVSTASANDAPVPQDDDFSGDEDTAITGNVLANDSDPDGDALTVTSTGTFATAAGGSVILEADGTFAYTPPADYNETDSFTYGVTDGKGGTANATLKLTVAPVNDAPAARDDAFSGDDDTAITGDVLANDSDPHGDALAVTSTGTFATAAGGSVTLEADGSFAYTPPAGYGGTDSFSYSVTDGQGGTASATATLVVAPVNDIPVARGDSATTNEDTAIVIDVLANDGDLDGDPLSVVSVSQGSHGSVTVNADGTLTYIPEPNFSGTDSFSYTISDGQGGSSTATTEVSVAPVNDAPLAQDDAYSGDEDTAITGNVLANDSDPDGDALTVTSTGTLATAAGGSVILNADGAFSYTPPAGYSGTDSFTYTISDGQGGSSTATTEVSVAPVNDAPLAQDDNFSGDEDTAITGNVLANDSDPDGDVLTVTSTGTLATAAGGSVTLNADGTFAYTPPAGYSGSDSFAYTVSDGQGGTSTATAALTVAPVNDAPVAQDDASSGDEDTAISGNVLANDSDPDGDALTVTSTGTLATAAGGSVTLNADGTFAYTPPADYSGTDSFTYTISDGLGGTDSATATLTVVPVNDAPVAQDDTAASSIDKAVTLDVLANDSDPDGDPLTVAAVTQGANGSVAVNPDGTVTYTPNSGYSGTDSFSYTVSDGQGGTATATVTVNVLGINSAPLALDDVAATAADTAVTLDVLTNDIDLEGDALTVTAVTQGAKGSVAVNPDGTVTYTPGAGFTGNDSFTYTVSDGAMTTTATVVVGVGSGIALIGTAAWETLVGTAGADDLDGRGGNDLLYGMGGNDILFGSAGDDTLYGGAGDDLLHGGENADHLDGGAGFDLAQYKTSGAAVVVDLAAGTGSGGEAQGDSYVDVEGVLGSDFGDTLTGDAAANELYGSDGADSLDGGAGSDVLDGGVGADSVLGGAGDDRIVWDATDSLIDGGTGTDSLITGKGALDLASAVDTVSGIDVIDMASDPAATNLTLTAADVLAISDTGTLTVTGDVADSVDAGAGWIDQGLDGAGNHVYTQIVGAETAMLIVAPDVALIIGTITVNGDPLAEDDIAATGMDTAVTIDVLANDSDPDGDPLALDSVTQGANGSVTVNADGTVTYTPNPGFTGTDTFGYIVTDGNGGAAKAAVTIGVGDGLSLKGTNAADRLVGTAGNDTLDGIGGNDILYGMAGNDVLVGGAGTDILVGGAGADHLDGGAGTDTADYSLSSAGVAVDLVNGIAIGGDAEGDTYNAVEDLVGSDFGDILISSDSPTTLDGGDGDDILTGGAGQDILIGGAGDDTLTGGDGADILYGGVGADPLSGGAGTDSATYAGSDAGVTIDLSTGQAAGGHAEGDVLDSIEVLTGSDFNDVLTGDAGLNGLNGGGGDDILYGGGGMDQVSGGAGNDIVNGGAGDDFLDGDAGNDIFVFEVGTGNDTIRDFSDSTDLMDLSDHGLAGIGDMTISNDGGGNTVVLLASGDSITIQGIDAASIDDTDFIF